MRSERLILLLQLLRGRKRPVSGETLARELNVSLRTVYRDIATLQGMGATIDGETGVGYVLAPSYFLPPLMFSEIEIEALTLGMRWVSTFADRPLAKSAEQALAKVEAVLPAAVRGNLGALPLRVGAAPPDAAGEDLSLLRQAIRDERKLNLTYCDGRGKEQDRIVWPFAIGYFVDGHILAAWCETRADYRHFRTSRIIRVAKLDQRTPRRRSELFRQWFERKAHSRSA